MRKYKSRLLYVWVGFVICVIYTTTILSEERTKQFVYNEYQTAEQSLTNASVDLVYLLSIRERIESEISANRSTMSGALITFIGSFATGNPAAISGSTLVLYAKAIKSTSGDVKLSSALSDVNASLSSQYDTVIARITAADALWTEYQGFSGPHNSQVSRSNLVTSVEFKCLNCDVNFGTNMYGSSAYSNSISLHLETCNESPTCSNRNWWNCPSDPKPDCPLTYKHHVLCVGKCGQKGEPEWEGKSTITGITSGPWSADKRRRQINRLGDMASLTKWKLVSIWAHKTPCQLAAHKWHGISTCGEKYHQCNPKNVCLNVNNHVIEGYSHNNSQFYAYGKYKASVFYNDPIKEVYWYLQKPGEKQKLMLHDKVKGGNTSSWSYRFDSTSGTYKVEAIVVLEGTSGTTIYHNQTIYVY